jgi:FMN phosphatase YigB (HAD superfamily)|tara:strand:+ start:1453 stop:1968 length:516 start_codon:yes stop_codon:yes gene_type:complete
MKNKTHNMKKAFVFDFDDTLAFTDACVLVLGFNGCGFGVVKRLTPAEFNTYELQKDEEFDFSQFQDSDFILDGKPTPLIELAGEVWREGHDLFILTARTDSVAGAIQEFLNQFYIKATAVHCVGDHGSDIAKSKRKVLLTIIESYDKIYFYDDDAANVKAAQEIGVKSYKV